MSCFPCFGRRNSSKDNDDEDRQIPVTKPVNKEVVTPKDTTPKKPGHAQKASIDGDIATTVGNIQAKAFTFRELAAATKNFRPDFLVGEGGFGRVYKGCLESNKQVVAIKQLDKNSFPSSKEFLAEVLNLSRLNHPNLVNLIGYCADGEQKLLVYEYLPLGSLENHILDLQPNKKPLSWEIRMNIAYGLAQGLEYLHDKANPQVIYRDLKSGNVLLDEHNNARLSDIGLAKLGPASENMHLSLGMIDGTYGYSAPEFERNGQVSVKADVYSFGVILLELITGRRAIDSNKEMDEQNLVAWAMPIVKDQKRLPEIVDPLLNGNYPVKALNQAVAMATMCVQEEASVRPMMADVVMALSFLSMEQNSQPGCSSSPHGASLDDSTQIEWYKPEDPTAAVGVITMDSSTSRQQLEP